MPGSAREIGILARACSCCTLPLRPATPEAVQRGTIGYLEGMPLLSFLSLDGHDRAACARLIVMQAALRVGCWKPFKPQPVLRRLACRASSSHGPTTPPVPLCKRPAIFESSLEALLSWRTDVLTRIATIGDSFEVTDGGPGEDELTREVGWVLDDVVSEVKEPGTSWSTCSWRNLETEIRWAQQQGRSVSDWQLKLRAPVEHLHGLWKRRLEGREPFQYLIATAHWREFVVSVSPGVLIPRPETELFPDLVMQALARRPELAAAPWADLGTGSGIIAIGTATALRKHNAAASVWAVDLSPVAIAHARYNAELADVSLHVQVVQGSWFQPLQQLRGKLGGVLSNPPYIPRAQMAGLQAEVQKHEPWTALDGGPNLGMESLQPICESAAEMLQPGGFLAFETAGHEQARAVCDLLLSLSASSSPAFESATVVDDCFGVPRFVVAWRASS